jgi:predicted nucleic acid-binding protein
VKISAALAGVQRLYVETAPFIYYVEKHPGFVDRLRQVFTTVNTNQIEIITSVVTLVETLTKPMRTKDKAVGQGYRNLLQQTQHITLVPITISIAEQAADLRARYNLRTPDALHLAAALDAGCNAFLTNDLALQRVTELPILILDDLELDPL